MNDVILLHQIENEAHAYDSARTEAARFICTGDPDALLAALETLAAAS
ncbi:MULTISPECIES: hypothetical protein [Rhodococcus]|nr:MULTISPECIES: hypothetical protein [Rhodococcus]MCE4161676.1 hypothetical protein [Rhodococcus sp. Ni2]